LHLQLLLRLWLVLGQDQAGKLVKSRNQKKTGMTQTLVFEEMVD